MSWFRSDVKSDMVVLWGLRRHQGDLRRNIVSMAPSLDYFSYTWPQLLFIPVYSVQLKLYNLGGG